MKTAEKQLLSIYVIGIFLWCFNLTSLTSCKVHKNIQKEQIKIDSVANTNIDSSSYHYDSLFWKKYLSTLNVDTTVISFDADTVNTIEYNTHTGDLKIKGKITQVRHSSKREQVQHDSLSSKTVDSSRLIDKSKVELKKKVANQSKVVDKTPSIRGWFIGICIALFVAFLVFAYFKWLKRFTLIP